MIKEVTDEKGISKKKLEHIFWGEVTISGANRKVKGYHCYCEKYKDTILYADTKLICKSNKRIITENKEQELFEAVVRERVSGTFKQANSGKSTFFNPKWTRQDIVDCIDRLHKNKKIIRKYSCKTKKNVKNLHMDPKTGLVVVDCEATAFPILKY